MRGYLAHSIALGAVAALCALPGLAHAAAAIPLAQAHLGSYRASYAISGAASGTQTWVVRTSGTRTDVTVQTLIAGQSETDQLVLGAHGLGLRAGTEKVSAPGVAVSIRLTVVGDNVDELAVVNGKTEHVTYDDSATTYVNEALLPTLAGLAGLRPGQEAVVHDLVVQHAQSVPVGLRVGRPVTVKTKAGAFQCLPVTLSSAGGNQTAWIATGKERVLVRYANGETTFTLTSFTA